MSVPDALRTLWGACYGADSTTVAVVGPQETDELLRLVQEAFGSMRRSGGSSGGSNGVTAGSNGVTAGSRKLLQPEDGDAAAGMCSCSCSGSASSSSEESDVEISTADGPAGTVAAAAAPEAAVHVKALQELWDPLGADAEPPCSQIAAPEHSQQQQQQDMLVSHVPMDHQQQQQQRHRYPVDVCGTCSVGQFVQVCPQRDLREVQVVWYIPAGAMTHSR